MATKSILDQLKNATTRKELARILHLKTVFLTDTVYRQNTNTQYKQFPIPKKNGNVRIISAPTERLKDIQRRVADLLYTCQNEINIKRNINPTLSHGFEKNRTIISNAERHRNKKIVLNIDLKDFFDSFNFGRVRGYFISNNDFKLNPTIATTLAQIACYQNGLPQGSPCSPIISNLICGILDIRLAKMGKKYGCTYSRYADDITFSTNKSTMPSELAIDIDGTISIGKELSHEIKRGGFIPNDSKTRLFYKNSKQEVTGLTVNKKVNVEKKYWKIVRVMAHTLYKDGLFTIKNGKGEHEPGKLPQLEGMFGFIDTLDKYNNIKAKKVNKIEKFQPIKSGLNFTTKLNSREKAYSWFMYYKHFHGMEMPTILTEGKTDRVYLKCALNSLASNYPTLSKIDPKDSSITHRINFFKASDKTGYFLDISGGATDFKRFIERYQQKKERYSKNVPKHPVIMLLDNDSGPNSVINHIVDKIENCPKKSSEIRALNYLHVFDNLYLILTPLSENNSESCMEDFFYDDVLKTIVDGRKFNKNNNIDSKSQYGKHDFSTKVVKKNEKTINFDKFSPIFDSIVSVIDHYNNLIK